MAHRIILTKHGQAGSDTEQETWKRGQQAREWSKFLAWSATKDERTARRKQLNPWRREAMHIRGLRSAAAMTGHDEEWAGGRVPAPVAKP